MHTTVQSTSSAPLRDAMPSIAYWGFTLLLALAGVAADAVTLTGALSRKTHGVNSHDVALDISQAIGGAVTVESRAIGPGHQIVFLFDVPVTFGVPTAVDEAGAPVAIASAVPGSNNEVIVTLAGVPDNKRVAVTLPNVSGVDYSVSLGFLAGDVNNSRAVSGADIAQMKSHAGQGVDASNIRFDLNATGAITAADIAAVKIRSPRALIDATLTGAALNVGKTGAGVGSVNSSPPGINCGADCAEAYAPATVVALTASANAGSAFTGWGGACSGMDSHVCSVSMNGTRSVTAHFMDGTAFVADANPVRATANPDIVRTVTQTVPLTGGSITTTGADGTVYHLDVPPNALIEPLEISMTPTASLNIPDLANDAAYGVELGPAGTTFHNFVTLTITPPAGANVPIDRQLPVGWSGSQNVVSLAAIDATSAAVKLKLLHFSGYALLLATKGTNATLEPARHRLGGDAEERLWSLAGERLVQERRKQLLGADPESILVLDDIFKLFDEQVVQPRIAAAGTSCAAGRLAYQTVLDFERRKSLLGAPPGNFEQTISSVMAVAMAACTREEYALCRDNHIITRILPYYIGMRRKAALESMLGDETTPDPPWLQDAEAAVAKCLNFELQVNSRLTYTDGVDVSAHTTIEAVESRVKLPYNYGAALLGTGYVSSSVTGPEPLISRSYDVNYPHACAQVTGAQRIGAGMMGSLGFETNAGGVAQRATVKDFYFTPAVMPNGLGSGYTLTRFSVGSAGCELPKTTSQENDNWVNNGFGTWTNAFPDPLLGLAIRNWTIVASDIMATKDFTTQESTGTDNAVVTTTMVLFHPPAP